MCSGSCFLHSFAPAKKKESTTPGEDSSDNSVTDPSHNDHHEPSPSNGIDDNKPSPSRGVDDDDKPSPCDVDDDGKPSPCDVVDDKPSPCDVDGDDEPPPPCDDVESIDQSRHDVNAGSQPSHGNTDQFCHQCVDSTVHSPCGGGVDN